MVLLPSCLRPMKIGLASLADDPPGVAELLRLLLM
jgi:hypothetical protein